MTTQSEGPQLRPTRAAWDAPSTAWVSTRYSRKWAPSSMGEPAANWIGGGAGPEQEPQAWLDGGRNAEVEAVGPPLSPSPPGQIALQGTLIAQNSA